jgi:hypothetical protein
MKFTILRYLLFIDAIVLAMLGLLLIFAPKQIATFFHFANLPANVSYLLGLWGCVMLSLGAAYAIASRDPIRHRLWIDIGIIRALLETAFGFVAMARGVADFSQAGFGTILAAALAVAYVALYPRPPRLVAIDEPLAKSEQKA